MSMQQPVPAGAPAYTTAEKPVMSGAAKGIGAAVLVSALVIIVSAFLAWETLGPISMDGFGNISGSGSSLARTEAAPGILTLGAAIPVALLAVLRLVMKRTSVLQLIWPILAILPTLAIILIAFVRYGKADEAGSDPAIGLHLTMVFAVIALIAEIAAIIKRK